MKKIVKVMMLSLIFATLCLSAAKQVEAKKNFVKHYLMLRSYLDFMSAHGGGTLTLKKGTYNLTNAILVPSNVTIVLKDGVVMNKTNNTHTRKLKAGHVMIECVRSSRINRKGIVGEYNGEKNIRIVGEGKVTMDLGRCNKSEAICIPHCQNVSIENISFTNLRDGHFPELDASKNVTISNYTFSNNKNRQRCAINLDTPDKVTNGFNVKTI